MVRYKGVPVLFCFLGHDYCWRNKLFQFFETFFPKFFLNFNKRKFILLQSFGKVSAVALIGLTFSVVESVFSNYSKKKEKWEASGTRNWEKVRKHKTLSGGVSIFFCTGWQKTEICSKKILSNGGRTQKFVEIERRSLTVVARDDQAFGKAMKGGNASEPKFLRKYFPMGRRAPQKF